MLIRNAEIWRGPLADARITNGRIAAIGSLPPHNGEVVIDARGGALLPGLHDHHIHLAATQVAQASIPCGPPDVMDEAELAKALAQPGGGWLRGVNYHESVAGLLDRRRLDALVPDRPLRIQHRSGRLWLLNSPAIAHLLQRASPPKGLDRASGHLFDEDRWLRNTLAASPPELDWLGQELARYGVTGVTDMSPANGPDEVRWLAGERAAGRLPQTCVVAGTEALNLYRFPTRLHRGPLKLHLHENALPDPDEVSGRIARAHAAGRTVAVHCTTEAELVFALACREQAGAMAGDRIEHAGIAGNDHVAWIARLGLAVVTQPRFLFERGDAYLALVELRAQPWLYRLGSFIDAGVTCALGSDAPYASFDPWEAMRSAVQRTSKSGAVIGLDERVTADQAAALYLADPFDLARQRRVEVGEPADLCLLDRSWAEARSRLASGDVRATIIGGKIIHQRIDQPPFERGARPDPPPAERHQRRALAANPA